MSTATALAQATMTSHWVYHSSWASGLLTHSHSLQTILKFFTTAHRHSVIWILLTLTTSPASATPLTHSPFFWSLKTPSLFPSQSPNTCGILHLERSSSGLCSADSGCGPLHAYHTLRSHYTFILHSTSVVESLFFVDLFAYLFFICSPRRSTLWRQRYHLSFSLSSWDSAWNAIRAQYMCWMNEWTHGYSIWLTVLSLGLLYLPNSFISLKLKSANHQLVHMHTHTHTHRVAFLLSPTIVTSICL